jgi:hypothetical protein
MDLYERLTRVFMRRKYSRVDSERGHAERLMKSKSLRESVKIPRESRSERRKAAARNAEPVVPLPSSLCAPPPTTSSTARGSTALSGAPSPKAASLSPKLQNRLQQITVHGSTWKYYSTNLAPGLTRRRIFKQHNFLRPSAK